MAESISRDSPRLVVFRGYNDTESAAFFNKGLTSFLVWSKSEPSRKHGEAMMECLILIVLVVSKTKQPKKKKELVCTQNLVVP